MLFKCKKKFIYWNTSVWFKSKAYYSQTFIIWRLPRRNRLIPKNYTEATQLFSELTYSTLNTCNNLIFISCIFYLNILNKDLFLELTNFFQGISFSIWFEMIKNIRTNLIHEKSIKISYWNDDISFFIKESCTGWLKINSCKRNPSIYHNSL